MRSGWAPGQPRSSRSRPETGRVRSAACTRLEPGWSCRTRRCPAGRRSTRASQILRSGRAVAAPRRRPPAPAGEGPSGRANAVSRWDLYFPGHRLPARTCRQVRCRGTYGLDAAPPTIRLDAHAGPHRPARTTPERTRWAAAPADAGEGSNVGPGQAGKSDAVNNSVSAGAGHQCARLGRNLGQRQPRRFFDLRQRLPKFGGTGALLRFRHRRGRPADHWHIIDPACLAGVCGRRPG